MTIQTPLVSPSADYIDLQY